MAWHEITARQALCEGKPWVIGGFPLRRPVMTNFSIFFVASMRNLLNKQSIFRRFHMPWRLCDIIIMLLAVIYIRGNIWGFIQSARFAPGGIVRHLIIPEAEVWTFSNFLCLHHEAIIYVLCFGESGYIPMYIFGDFTICVKATE